METFIAARVWDGTSTEPIQKGFVRVDGERIDAVGRAADLPESTKARDLGEVTLMPGLINGHVHISFSAAPLVLDAYLAEREAGTDTLIARARDNLEKSIKVGCTTVRDLGTLNDVVFAVRSAVRDGTLLGSDVIAAGEGITSNGGHCHFFGVEAEGVDQVRDAVRRQKDAGADLIKVFATGGNLTPGTDPFAPQYSVEELRTVVDEARDLGMPVACHAHAPEGIRRSVAARVNTIEHCLFETSTGVEFDERAAEGMAEHGIAVLPTLGYNIIEHLRDPTLVEALPELPRSIVSRLLAKTPTILANFARMREMGVTVIAGSDSGIPNRHFDAFPADVAALAEDPGIAMGARAALEATTSRCADALGLTDRGVLEAGRRADLLAVEGNPLERIEDLQATRFVMCAGRIAVDR
jgi:imidazolonepropionase-like amidohydrolase